MKDFEILCRGSAFITPVRKENFPNKYHVVTSSHVVAPWRWPTYYNAEWLKYVNETHTHYTLEVRHDDGSFIYQQDLVPRVFHHENKDLAILHIDFSEAKGTTDLEIGALAEFGLNAVQLSTQPVPIGSNLTFYGHELSQSNSNFSVSAEEGMPVPSIISGKVIYRSLQQVFATSSLPLKEGMCGGPVINEADGTVAGVLEGTVPSDHAEVQLRGSGVFVESTDIAKHLSDVEEGLVDALAGEAWKIVGSDQDPAKMDLEQLKKF